MDDYNILLNSNENFDGIVDKITIEYNSKSIQIIIKRWNSDETHNLSFLNFNGVIFQSLPDISSFNLINEIVKNKNLNSVLCQFNEYLDNNSTLAIPNTRDNIINEIQKEKQIESYFLISGYCKDWLIVCQEMILTERINIPNIS